MLLFRFLCDLQFFLCFGLSLFPQEICLFSCKKLLLCGRYNYGCICLNFFVKTNKYNIRKKINVFVKRIKKMKKKMLRKRAAMMTSLITSHLRQSWNAWDYWTYLVTGQSERCFGAQRSCDWSFGFTVKKRQWYDMFVYSLIYIDRYEVLIDNQKWETIVFLLFYNILVFLQSNTRKWYISGCIIIIIIIIILY